jgi:membrane-bound serine protease (ClpP class)
MNTFIKIFFVFTLSALLIVPPVFSANKTNEGLSPEEAAKLAKKLVKTLDKVQKGCPANNNKCNENTDNNKQPKPIEKKVPVPVPVPVFSNSNEIEEPESKNGVEVHLTGKALVLPIHEMITPTTQKMVEKWIDKANRESAKLIILEIDTPGGYVKAVEPICKKLLQCEIPSVALVTNQAISGGSMVATACNEIVMVQGATIGDCEPHAMIGTLPANMREKIETTIRADMRANAQANGYPDKILEAMVTKSFELYLVEFADGEKELLYKNEIELIEEQIKKGELKREIKGRKIIVKEGNLLTLTAKEAVEYKLASTMVKNTGEFYNARNIRSSDIVRPTKAKAGEMNLKLQMVLAAFLIIGIAGIVVESQVPGFGIPGVVGIIGFACFFSTLFFYDRASVFEITLFVVGIILLLVEIFILPGFGVAGIGGVCCILASIILGYMPASGAGMDWRTEAWNAINVFSYAVIGSLILGILLVKYLPKIPIFNNMLLPGTLRAGTDVNTEIKEKEFGSFPHEEMGQHVKSKLIGQSGVVVSVLRPSGKMRTEEGLTLDVVSSGTMIKEGAKVKIVDVNGPRIEVVEVS